MAIIDLGKIKPINRGTWSNSTTYAVDDFVLYGKHSFISKVDSNLNNIPYNQDTGTLDSTNWDFLARGSEIDHKGEWDAATSYTLNDVVRQKESSFICTNAPALNQDPFDDATQTLNSSYWAFFANGNRLVHQGDWDVATPYILHDLVTHGKHTFRCVLAHTGEDPYNESTSTLNSTYWTWFAQGTAQADWNATEGDSQILNKPVVKFGGALRHSRAVHGDYTYRNMGVVMNDGTFRTWGADSSYCNGRGDNNSTMYSPSGNGCQGYIEQLYVNYNSMCALDNRGRAYGWGYQGHYAYPFNTSSNYPMPREIKLSYTTGHNYDRYPLNGQRYRIYEIGQCGYDGSGTNYFALYCTYDQDNKTDEFPLGRPEVWASGHQTYGQLGVGNTNTYQNGVGPISQFSGKKIKQICIGGSYYGHPFLITDKSTNHRGGELWGWGYNGYGQVGTGSTNNTYQPAMKNGTAGLPDAPVKYVWTTNQGSYGNTFCIMEDQGAINGSGGTPRSGWSNAGDGSMWYCGHNNYGQAGDGGASQRNSWSKSYSGHWAGQYAKWDHVLCAEGNYCWSIAIDAWGGHWTTGYNGNGQLGIGNSSTRYSWGTTNSSNSEGVPCPSAIDDLSDKLHHSTSSGSFQAGEIITGSTSGAKAWAWSIPNAQSTSITFIKYQSTNTIVGGRSDLVEPIYTGEQCTDQNQTGTFLPGETITGSISGATATLIEETSLTKVVTVNGSNQFVIDGSTQPTMELREQYTWTFDVSDSSNTGHVLSFSNISNGTHASGYEWQEGVSRSGTPGQAGATVTWKVPKGMNWSMYYYCPNHSSAGSSINTPQYPFHIGYARDHRTRAITMAGGNSSSRLGGFIQDEPKDDGTSQWDAGEGGQYFTMGYSGSGGMSGNGSNSTGSTYHGVSGTQVGNSYYPMPTGGSDTIAVRIFGYDGENTGVIITSKGQVFTWGYSGSHATGQGYDSGQTSFYRPGLLKF